MKRRQITIKNDIDQFENARNFVADGLEKLKVPKQTIMENELVFEEIMLLITEQYKEEKPDITISLIKSVGEVKILISFYGKRFDIDFQSMDQNDPGLAILGSYEDKIGLNYKKSHNSICIIAKRTFDKMGLMCNAAMLVAVIVYGIVQVFLNDDALMRLCNNVIIPFERMFTNMIIMIAGPVTFFSIVTNITNCHVIANNRISLGKLEIKAVLSSALAEVIAVLFFIVLKNANVGSLFTGGEIYNVSVGSFFTTFIDSLWKSFPNDISQLFTSASPFPMILIATITSASICTMNKHFNTIKKMNDAINDLFGKALSIIMMFLPVASFLAIFDALLEYGFQGLLTVYLLVIFLLSGVLLMIIVAMIKVALYGINPFYFIKKCLPAAVNNYRINSSIDAAPYNIRFCNITFGIGLDKLDMKIPILAQINQTGNCFIIMVTTLFMMYYTKITTDPMTVILLGIMVIFVSMGAPGKEGSLLIGLAIIFSFVGVSIELIASVIYIEAIVGRILPVLNTLFDITTVVTEDKKFLERSHQYKS